MQKEKSKTMFEAVVNEELSVAIARLQLKTLYLPGNAIKLILNTATIMHANRRNTLHTHDLGEFYHLIDKQNLNELGFPDFVIHRRKNLMHKKFSCSPMHVFDLGELALRLYHIVNNFNNTLIIFKE